MRCVHCHRDLDGLPARCPGCREDPRLEGRYVLEAVIGEGAVATLYRGHDQRRERPVAIKERHPRGVIDATQEAMFEREARVLRQLDHPQVPDYVDAFASGVGRARRHYLVQELVDGRSLDQELPERRYTERDALATVREIAAILDYLHTLSPPVVHRDLKPGNVMRRRDGTLVLVDFGAVRDTLPGTLGGATVAGTFGFMAPEQFMGDALPASDIYALGALAVALLSRRDPATMHDASRRFAWRRAVTLSGPAMDLLAAMLADEPTDRPSAAEVMARIDERGALRDAPRVGRDRAGGAAPAKPSRDVGPRTARAQAQPPRAAPVAAPATHLEKLAARGEARKARERERTDAARRRSAAREAASAVSEPLKRLHEGITGPVAGWLFRHQYPLTIASAPVGLFAVIGGLVWAIERLPIPEWLAGWVLGLGIVGGMIAVLALPFLADLVLPPLARRAHRRERRRLSALPLDLDLDAYATSMEQATSRGGARITLRFDRAVDAATVKRLGDALAGLRLEGSATRGADPRQIVLTSGVMELSSLHGKGLNHRISHHSLAHAWVRRVLRGVLLPHAAALGVRSVHPELWSK